MQRIAAGFNGQVHQLARVQVTGQRVFANAVCFVRTLDVQSVAISLGINRYGAYAHLCAGTHDTDGNFSAVGDQDLFYHLDFSLKPMEQTTC